MWTKDWPWLVPGTELNLTNAHQQSATKRSGSVHKTNCKCRTVTVPQVSLQKHQDCAAITASATEVGQNETPVQIMWASLAVANILSTCGSLWVSAVSQTGMTSTKDSKNIEWDLFPMVNRLGQETDLSHVLSWQKKERTHPLPDTPVHFYPNPKNMSHNVTLYK